MDQTIVATCCNPKPGDTIIGHRLDQDQVEIHHLNCGQFWTKSTIDSRVEVYWTTPEKRDQKRRRDEHRQSLSTMPYAEYLKTPEWKKRRRRAVMRAKRKCQLCGNRDQVLHVHHNTYDNRGAEPACDLIVLCADCHEWFHKTDRTKALNTRAARLRYIEDDYADHIKPQGLRQ